MQISFVMLIFLLFFGSNFRGAKVSEGEQTASGGSPSLHTLWKKVNGYYNYFWNSHDDDNLPDGTKFCFMHSSNEPYL